MALSLWERGMREIFLLQYLDGPFNPSRKGNHQGLPLPRWTIYFLVVPNLIFYSTSLYKGISVMLISFSLSNFKSFKRLESIGLKPLTVICDPNNSGKSSIIQSLLLMKPSRRISRIAPPPLLATNSMTLFFYKGRYFRQIF